MRILITGGAGYIGGRLATYFADKGNEIIVTSRVPRNSRSRSGVKFKIIKWEDVDGIKRLLKDIDLIIHASGVNAKDAEANYSEAIKCNALYTSYLVDSAIEAGVKKFIYFSTAHVYRSPLVGLIDEETACINTGPYGATHHYAEGPILYARNKKGFDAYVLRLSNSFGYPFSYDVNVWSLVVLDMCMQAAVNNRILLSSSGEQLRDFITLEDVCEVVNHFMIKKHDSNDNGIYNVGTGISRSINYMAELIASRCQILYGRTPEIKRSKNDVEPEGPLVYKVDKLLGLGIELKNDFVYEIDKTLEFCTINQKNK